jgi:hypothetical protein
MSNYESGMGSGRDADNLGAPESGMGASEGFNTGAGEQGMGRSEGYSTGASEQGMGASESYRTGESEQGMGASERYGTGAAEQGMGASETTEYQDRSDEYGMGSGRASDEKEGKVGKMFDKIKERLTRPHEENK